MNFFNLPVEIRQSIYDINKKQIIQKLKADAEYNKNKLLKDLNNMIKQHEPYAYQSGYTFYESTKIFNGMLPIIDLPYELFSKL